MKLIAKNIKNWIVALAFVASTGGAMLTIALPQAAAAVDGDACNQGFLGFPPWYRGLTTATCGIKSPGTTPGDDLPTFIWTIGLNVVEMVLVAIAYVAAFYLLYGGFLFMTSQGKPEIAAKARSAILNAIIGLILSMMSIAVVEFVVGKIAS